VVFGSFFWLVENFGIWKLSVGRMGYLDLLIFILLRPSLFGMEEKK
jgi:hypothetical protein